MKTFKLFTCLFLMLNFITLHADTSETNNFESGLESWSGTGVSIIYKSGSYKMRINQDSTASKTFSFGTSYANASVTIDFSVQFNNKWHIGNDYFYIKAFGSTLGTYSDNNAINNETVTTTTDANGNLALSYNSIINTIDTGDERAFIDNIVVSVVSPAGANLSLSEYTAPSPSYADIYEDINISVRASHLGTIDAQPNTQLLITYNQDINITQDINTTSALQINGNDFNCSVSSGILPAGSPITCTMTTVYSDGATDKDFSFVVQATTYGDLIQTSEINSSTLDTNFVNNTLISTPIPISKKSYCERYSLSEGFNIIDPDAGSNKNSFEIFCYSDTFGIKHDLIALPIKNSSNNFLFGNDVTSSNYYDESANHRTHFHALEINANYITYSGTLDSGVPRPIIDVIIGVDTEPYSITTDGNNYKVMGTSFSNINLIGTPFKIDWNNTGSLNGCDENLLRKALGQAVKYNTINDGGSNDGKSRCEITDMKLTLLDDYQYLTYGGTEVLQHSCKEMATYIPNNIFSDSSIDGYFNILTTEPEYVTGVPTTNGVRNNSQDIGEKLRPLTVYCKYQTDLAYVWTFLTALDAKVTQNKVDLVNKSDTCSQLGLFFYVPNNKTTFNRVREYLKDSKTGDDGWENYTGTIDEKINALYAGNHYYLSAFRDVEIWPYGPMGIYFPYSGNRDINNLSIDWGDGANSPKEHMSGSPMHNITTMANYPDSMGKKGFVSILGSQDLNKTNDWWLADIGAGLEIGYSTPLYSPSGTHPMQSAGYIYYEPNGNYTAEAWLNFLFDSEGWIYHNDDWNDNYPYYDYMCMSETNYDTVGRYSLVPGFFTLIERSKNTAPYFSDANISTQIVSKPFQLDLILYKINPATLIIDTTTLNDDENKSVGVFLSTVEGNNPPIPMKYIGEYQDFDGNDGRIQLSDITIPSANKRVVGQFFYCDAADTNWSICWDYTGGPNSPKLTPLSDGDYSDSFDDFAIRPDKFSITSISGSIVKAEDVNISYIAYDFINNATINYNEPFSNLSVSASLADPTKLVNCPNTTLNLDLPFSFNNGIEHNTTRLNNIGIFNINISEQDGQEFAIVDKNDTIDIDRFITPSDVNLSILPHHFTITPITNINNGANFTYLANNLDNMGLKFDINVTAENSINDTTPNYTTNCYSNNINLEMAYNSATGANFPTTIIYKELKSGIDGNNTASDNNLSLPKIGDTLPSSLFTNDNNGTAELSIRVNFQRDLQVPLNPFVVNFDNLNISDQNNVLIISTDNSSIDNNGSMVYGRTHASRQRYDGNSGDANIYYEVYCFATDTSGTLCIPTLLSANISPNLRRTDDIRWYINEIHNIANDGVPGVVIQEYGTNTNADIVTATDTFTGSTSITTLLYDANNDGVNNESYPYKTTIENNASSWLIYNENNINATVNQFQVEFTSQGSWSGEKDTTITTTDNNTTTITNRRSMW